ncbi:MAG: PAS domain S-box protein [Bacteroidota bacterium]
MVPDALPPHLAAPLAELATAAIAEAAFGDADVVADSAVEAIGRALEAPVCVLSLDDLGGGERACRAEATWGADPPEAPFPVSGPWAEALAHEAPVMAESLEPWGGAGCVIRIGSTHTPLALLAVRRADLDEGECAFVRAAASVLHARLALDRQRHGLAESEARARAVVETSVDGVITIDARGRIDLFNPGAERIFGYAAEDVRGQNVHMLMPEPYHAEHDGYVQAYLDTGVRRIIGIGREVLGRRASGATFPMDLAVSEVRLADGSRLFVGLVRDISERRLLEQEVTRIAEEERRRIGQDLHDGLGQTLTGIGLFARGLARQLDAEGSGSADAARQVISLLNEADAHARALARSLVPVELETNGLEAALGRMAERASQLYGSTVRAGAEGTGVSEADVLSGAAATHLFRIAQEAVSNGIQHGRAESIRVRLIRGVDKLRLRVEDDGVGFDETLRPGGILEPASGLPPEASGSRSVAAPARPADHRGMGLRIMHHRAHLAGGTLEIRPGADGGTVVTCTVPLRHAQL